MSTKQKKTIQKGSFKRLLKLFFFKNKMLTALMLFSIIISAVATALGPQYLGYATDSIVQDMSNPVSSNIHWDRFFFWAGELCRYRHNIPYADILEMPIFAFLKYWIYRTL